MKYSVEITPRFEKELNKLEKYTKTIIIKWINKYLEGSSNPRKMGKALQGKLKGLWRYRIGSYRIICEINDEKLIIIALTVGDRKNVYNKH